jgi:tRNA threonylcarbamoyl adenosine modification protein YeaZ
MIVLAIDTSTPAVTAGLVLLPDGGRPPRLLAERVTVDARAHAELLAPQIHELLQARPAAGSAAGPHVGLDAGPTARPDAGLDAGPAAGPEAIVCGTGPGPFTGLRVGMVTAAALGDGLGVPVYGACSLDAIAAAAGMGGAAADLLVATDARRREVYWAVYRGGARVDGPHVQRPAELARQLRSLGVTAATGAGAELYADVLGLPLLNTPYPTAAGLVAVAADALRRRAEPPPLVPLYLRRPDAAEPGPRKLVTALPVDKS